MANTLKSLDKTEPLHSIPEISQTGRHTSPSPTGLRQRPLARAATFGQPSTRFDRRNSSFLSDSHSEARRSIRSSTDDFILPRVRDTSHESIESSHWHSVPLGLALLPAIGGLFFQNGSSFVTDVTLLGLAALFLNWSVRLPWDWYHAAQEMISETEESASSTPLRGQSPELGVQDVRLSSSGEADVAEGQEQTTSVPGELQESARQELRIHELLALLACFVCPILGAWLLHAIRSQLSRPSEGLVSNYNLTIFLLGAEIRPLSHLIKLIQRRTLFLQKTVSASVLREQSMQKEGKILDIMARLDELEAHTADTIAAETTSKVRDEMTTTGPNQTPPSEDILTKAATFATLEMRKQTQPELDALNRAMRRYEKRTTISAIQTEARLQDLEAKIENVVVLAAAAQRNVDKSRTYSGILLNWISALIVVPARYAVYVISIPGRLVNYSMDLLMRTLKLRSKPGSTDVTISKNGKAGMKSSSAARQRARDKKSKSG